MRHPRPRYAGLLGNLGCREEVSRHALSLGVRVQGDQGVQPSRVIAAEGATIQLRDLPGESRRILAAGVGYPLDIQLQEQRIMGFRPHVVQSWVGVVEFLGLPSLEICLRAAEQFGAYAQLAYLELAASLRATATVTR